MEINFEYKPLEIHKPFHESRAKHRCLIGAVGSGKTYALCAEGLKLGLQQPGSHILVTRKTAPELRDTTEPVFLEIIPADLLKLCDIKRSGGHLESVTLPNGTKYIFRSMDDWQKHKSLNLAFILWDEADEFSEEDYIGMGTRLRQTVPLGAENRRLKLKIDRKGHVMATNPNGRDWVHKNFVDLGTRMPGRDWFKSTSFDNPFLPEDFLIDLLNMPEPWIKRYVLCQFDDFAGQVYESFSYAENMIDPIPRSKLGTMPVFWQGFDPGIRNNTASLWVYVDVENARLIGVREYIGSGMAATDHAREFRRIENEYQMRGHVRARIADPSITKRDQGTAIALEDYYKKEGFRFDHGPVSEKQRVPILGQMIHNRKFLLMRGECDQTADQIANLRWKELTPAQKKQGVDAPESVLKKNSDLVDTAQYVCSRYLKPAKIKVKSKLSQHDQEIWQHVKKAQARAAAQRRRGSTTAATFRP